MWGWGAWIDVAVGMWLIMATWVLNFSYSTGAMLSTFLSGIVITIIALVVGLTYSYANDTRGLIIWIDAVAGAWLVAAPFVLGFVDVTSAALNSFIFGGIVLVVSALVGVSYLIWPPHRVSGSKTTS